MSEEEIVEKSKADMLTESLANVTSPIVVFIILVALFSLMLYLGKIDQALYEKLILSGALASLLLKLAKKEE